MQVRRLNSTGLARFKTFLGEARLSSSPPEMPTDILTSRSTSSGLNVAIEIEPVSGVSSKLELTRYLHEKLRPLDQDASLGRNGMWSWLGLFMYDTLCPVNPSTGRRTTRQDWYYIFQPDDGPQNFQTYYRHLLYTPYHLYRSFQESAGRVLLTGESHVGGEMIEQIASRLEYISCRAVLEALDHLYLDDTRDVERLKSGATSRNRGGALGRFITFLEQIAMTYDLYGMTGENILDLLPPEFDEWK